MNRRDLLKKIGIAAPALVAGPLLIGQSVRLPLNLASDDFRYRGWLVRWRGWRLMYNMDMRVGLWMAYGGRDSRFHIYSSVPGTAGSVVEGAIFDVSFRPNQRIPWHDATEDDLNEIKAETLKRLKLVIDEAGPPPLNHQIWLD